MRQTGSHVLLWKPGLLRPVVIAKHNRELSAATVSSILRQADVSAEEFLKHVQPDARPGEASLAPTRCSSPMTG